MFGFHQRHPGNREIVSMPFPWLAVILIATIALSYLIRPKVQTQKPASLADFNVPTATEIRPLSVVVGTVWHQAPNAGWDGDLKPEKLYSKVPNPLTFGLTKKNVWTGQYKYHLGIDELLCHGEGVRLRAMKIGSKYVWTGDIISGSFSFNLPNLFGGDQSGGGYAGTFNYYGGSWTQTRDPYLVAQNPSAIVSHQKGVCHILQLGPSSGDVAPKTHNGYVGNSTSLQPYSFVLSRIPDGMGQTSYATVNSQSFTLQVFTGDGSATSNVSLTMADANPIEWAYELLINSRYGMGVAAGMIDIETFKLAARTCHDEGLGLSVLWDAQRSVEDVINDIVKLVDGACYVDRTTGLWTFKLMRPDYDPDALVTFDESNILEYESFGVNTYDETPNIVVVNYVSKGEEFKSRPADFRDLASRRTQGCVIATPMDFYGVAFQSEAQQLAFRETKVYSANLRTARFKVNRKGHWVRCGSVFKFSRPSMGISSIIMRCTKVDDGQLFSGEIEISCIQDVFSLGTSKYNTVPNTAWVRPINTPAVISNAKVIESPFFFSGNAQQIMTFARPANSNYIDYDFRISESGQPYASREDSAPFTPMGTLTSAYSGLTADIDTSNSLTITKVFGMSQLAACTATDILAGENLIYFEDTEEFAAFQDITDNGDGTVTLNNVWRGIVGSPRMPHASGSRVWFISYGMASSEEDDFDLAEVLNVKHVTRTINGLLPESSATAFPITIGGRYQTPYPPGNIKINTSYTSSSASGDLTFAWNHRDRTQQDSITRDSTSDIGPEAGVTYTVKIYNDVSNALLHTYSNLTGNSLLYTAAQETTDNGGSLTTRLRFEIQAVRGSVVSWLTAKRIIDPRNP